MAADTANKVLEVEDINVYYGAIHAIKDVSFEVHEGEIVALIGANGAGKSTTAQDALGPAALEYGFDRVHGRGHHACPRR